MMHSYRIAIADDDHDVRQILHTHLTRAGHKVIVEASSGEDLLERCTADAAECAELVIVDIKMSGMSGLEAAQKLYESRNVPFIIVSGFWDDSLIAQALTCGAFAYLQKPIRAIELEAAIQIAVRRFDEIQTCQAAAATTRQALEDRKVIERAKGILMRERNLDEPSAFMFLQQMARHHRKKMVEVAKSINLAEQALCDN